MYWDPSDLIVSCYFNIDNQEFRRDEVQKTKCTKLTLLALQYSKVQYTELHLTALHHITLHHTLLRHTALKIARWSTESVPYGELPQLREPVERGWLRTSCLTVSSTPKVTAHSTVSNWDILPDFRFQKYGWDLVVQTLDLQPQNTSKLYIPEGKSESWMD